MGRAATLATGAAIVAVAVVLALTSTPGPTRGTGDGDGTGDGLAASLLGVPEGTAVAAGLTTAASCDEFATTMEELAAASGRGPGGPGWLSSDGMAVAASGEDAAEESAVAGAGAARGATGTVDDGTNVQEAGVDEPDVVERVGELTVVGTQGVLRVVTVGQDGAPVVRGELAVGSWSELQLLGVGDDRVVAIVGDGAAMPVRGVDDGGDTVPVLPSWSTTSVVLVDLVDPGDPRELSRVDMEGWLVDARAVDGVLRIAVAGDGPHVDVHALGEFDAEREMDWDTATEEEITAFERAYEEEYARRMEEGLAAIEPADWQPHARITDAGGTAEVVPLVGCDRIGFPTAFAGVGTLTVAAIDATGDALAVDDAEAVVASGHELYATADRVVVATTRWEPCCVEEPTDPAPEVDPFFDEDAVSDDGAGAVDDALASAASARPLAMAVEPGLVDPMRIVPWRPSGSTDLHVFDVDGTIVSHVASGSVDGWLLNQFAMSIHEGVLRVATTRADDDVRTASAVTTFRVEGTDLVELGHVDGLGPDEEIQSVRFMGDVGYVVTFRRTDPLYVVDLADPVAPRALGELKVEGYSAYLHPLGPGLLLGVGQDADPATGVAEGVQVSTFDVVDPRTPTRIDVDVTPDSHSEVEWDHHALTVTRDGTVLVPFEQWEPEGGRSRLGVLVYEVADDGGLDRVGVLDHGSRWELRPRRTLDLGPVLLTVGDQGVTTWDATTFEPLGSVTFPEPDWELLEEQAGRG